MLATCVHVVTPERCTPTYDARPTARSALNAPALSSGAEEPPTGWGASSDADGLAHPGDRQSW